MNEPTKDKLKAIGITAVLVIGITAIINQPEKEQEMLAPTTVEVVVTATPAPTPVTQYQADVQVRDQFKDSFLEGCTDAGQVSAEFCGCTYEYILAEYGLIFFFENADMTELTTEMYEALASCSEYL